MNVTNDHKRALQQILESALQKGWDYYKKGGWAGNHLHDLMRQMEIADQADQSAFDFFEATPIEPTPEGREAMILDMMSIGKVSREDAERAYAHSLEGRIVKSSKYQVTIFDAPNGFKDLDMVHLSIKRIDREPIHDWRDLQTIKNILVGEECEAIEVYPAESRLVDSANQYHLWAFTSSEVRVPVGFGERLVDEKPIGQSTQRPFQNREALMPSKAQLETSLRELSEWMREHTGPSDGTLDMLKRTVALLDEIDKARAQS